MAGDGVWSLGLWRGELTPSVLWASRHSGLELVDERLVAG
jgi:hypothetical protein